LKATTDTHQTNLKRKGTGIQAAFTEPQAGSSKSASFFTFTKARAGTKSGQTYAQPYLRSFVEKAEGTQFINVPIISSYYSYFSYLG
jgi:hypothetical protein